MATVRERVTVAQENTLSDGRHSVSAAGAEENTLPDGRVSAFSVEECWKRWKKLCDERIERMQEIETENNRLFIKAYGLADELSPEVPLSQITLARADAERDARRLLSYFVGCLMGRYSLDSMGLIYADAGGVGFDSSRYRTFPADENGIVPVTDLEWFPQEAARRFEEFLAVVFKGRGSEMRDEKEEPTPDPSSPAADLRWLSGQLGAKADETPLATIRRYFSSEFFRDHLRTYKKRPVYWLFSSGRQKAFECLVYLHRYDESTLPRMRSEYVAPLTRKIAAAVERLENQIPKAAAGSDRAAARKRLAAMRKKQKELGAFDELLLRYADRRIKLDLDDGVRVNYGKFGALLAEIK
jgi:hypothetical protein